MVSFFARFALFLGALILLVLCGILIFLRQHPSEAAFLVFNSNRTGDFNLYTMHGDGSNVRHLLTTEYNDLHPRWSPDGLSLIFDSDRDVNFELFVLPMRRNATAQPLFDAPNSDEYMAAWFPDGRSLVFVGNEFGNGGLYTATLGQTKPIPHQIVDYLNVPGITSPDVSPDGEWLLATATLDNHFAIVRMRADGSELTSLTTGTFNDRFPRWSPDGQWIAFTSDRAGMYQLYKMPVTGGDPERLSRLHVRDWGPSWSSDGRWIAIVVEETDGDSNIYRLHPDGTGLQKLTDHPDEDIAPSWSPTYDSPWNSSLLVLAGGLMLVFAGVSRRWIGE